MIQHVILYSDYVMQRNNIPFRRAQGAESERPSDVDDVRHDGTFNWCCDEWPVLAVFWILNPLTGELS
jgi:hypothetical protein